MGLRESFISKAGVFKAEPFVVDDETTVYLRPMSKGTRSRMEAIISGQKTAKDCTDVRWIVLASCMVDETGALLLKSEDRQIFDSWQDSVIEPIFERVLEMSKVTESDREEFGKN